VGDPAFDDVLVGTVVDQERDERRAHVVVPPVAPAERR
jgi:hypothetical protein